MNNTDLLARARLHMKQAKGQNPFHLANCNLEVKPPTCDTCNQQVGNRIALVGLSWRSGWLYICDTCVKGGCVSSVAWNVINDVNQ